MEPKHTSHFSPVTQRPLDELLGAMKMDRFAERIPLDVYLTSPPQDLQIALTSGCFFFLHFFSPFLCRPRAGRKLHQSENIQQSVN